MNKTVFLLILCLLFLGALAGYFTSPVHDQAEPTARSENWRTPARPSSTETLLDETSKRALTANLLPKPRDYMPSNDLDTPVSNGDQEGPIPFPRILSTARIDGEFSAQLSLDSGELISVQVGDTLNGDWEILEITLSAVKAKRNGGVFQIDLGNNLLVQ